MFVGITTDSKMIMQDARGRYFIAGQYGRPAFNDFDRESFILVNTYEVDGIGIKVQNKVTGVSLLEIKDLKFI
jgi:hypothetical protein